VWALVFQRAKIVLVAFWECTGISKIIPGEGSVWNMETDI